MSFCSTVYTNRWQFSKTRIQDGLVLNVEPVTQFVCELRKTSDEEFEVESKLLTISLSSEWPFSVAATIVIIRPL